MEMLCYISWVVTCVIIAWKFKHPMYVYIISTILAGIPIIYSQQVHGILEVGGLFHILCAGLYPLGLHYLFSHIKSLKRYHNNS